MTMLRPDELLSSPVVANATMNRGRGLGGVNSYERELRVSLTDFLAARAQQCGHALWYDACCGQGRALMEAATQFQATDWGRAVQIVGVDLVDMFTPERAPGVTLIAADVAAFRPARPTDLLTCVHGLHYLGDKLGFLETAYAMLAPGGLLLAHLDPDNLRALGSGDSVWRQAARCAAKGGVPVVIKGHVLRIEKTDSPLAFGLAYQGATVSERPNYTGITVMDSWYAAP